MAQYKRAISVRMGVSNEKLFCIIKFVAMITIDKVARFEPPSNCLHEFQIENYLLQGGLLHRFKRRWSVNRPEGPEPYALFISKGVFNLSIEIYACHYFYRVELREVN